MQCPEDWESLDLFIPGILLAGEKPEQPPQQRCEQDEYDQGDDGEFCPSDGNDRTAGEHRGEENGTRDRDQVHAFGL